MAIAQPLWSRWQAPHPLGLLPPEVAIEEIGLMPQQSVWRNTAAVLGVDTSALSAFYRCSSASNASMATLVSVSCATSFVSVSGFTC